MPIIAPIPRHERRQMQKIVQKTSDKNYAKRLIAMPMLHRGNTLTYVDKTLCVGRWVNLFTLYGDEGLESLSPGRPRKWPTEAMLKMLDLLVQHSPQDFGYLRLGGILRCYRLKLINYLTRRYILAHFGAGYREPVLYGVERPPLYTSEILIKRKNWWLSIPH